MSGVAGPTPDPEEVERLRCLEANLRSARQHHRAEVERLAEMQRDFTRTLAAARALLRRLRSADPPDPSRIREGGGG